MQRFYCVVLLALGCTLACSSAKESTRASNESPAPAEDSFYDHIGEKPANEGVATGGAVPLDDAERGGEIDRTALVSFLDLGPPALLRNVQVYPVLEGERFVGFEIQTFFPKHEQMKQIDLRKGDVVVSVNNVRIERPDDLFQVWEGLRTAPRLQVDFIRGTTLQTYTWEIVD